MARPTHARACALLLAGAIAGATSSSCVHAQTSSPAESFADAVRLLEQSTFGPTDALIGHVMQVGTQAFLNEQFAAPASQYPAIKYVPAGQQATFCPTDPDPQCGRDYYTLFLLQNAFFTNALYNPDQLSATRGLCAVADPRDIGTDREHRLRHGEVPADLPRQRLRQLRADPDAGDACRR